MNRQPTLEGRLSQPLTSEKEALEQLSKSVPLTEAGQKLLQALKDAPKRVVLIDSTQHIFLGEDTKGHVDKLIKRSLAQGKTVVENGTSTWIEHAAIMDLSKSGSDVYIFHKDGNRVRCEKFLHVKTPDGNVTKTKLGEVWRDAIGEI